MVTGHDFGHLPSPQHTVGPPGEVDYHLFVFVMNKCVLVQQDKVYSIETVLELTQ